MDINRLIEPHHSFRPPPEGMNNMVGILRSKPRKNNFPMIRFAIAVGVFQKKHIIAIRHIDSPVPGKHASWNMQIICKNRMLIRNSIPTGIFQYNQLVGFFLTWFNMRIQRTSHHP